MRGILHLLLMLSCTGHLVQPQFEMEACYNDQGIPTRCQPQQQPFAFEMQPSASSTCGSPPSPFCARNIRFGRISSSECNEVCDAQDPLNSHPPEYLTDFIQANTWWQSENSLDPQNVVNIDISLGALVETTLVAFQFQSLIPNSFQILKSVDYGATYSNFHYFATSCFSEFGIPEGQMLSVDNETSVLCQAINTPPLPGQISFFTVLDRPSANDSIPGFSEGLYDFMSATNIRVVLLEHYVIPDLAPDDLGYYYAIRDLNVLGSCQCHGHASQCRVEPSTGDYTCMCQHNTTGQFCERCSDFYQDLPWQRATGATAFECRACNCNGQSEECRFDPGVYEETNRVSGGVCLNCRNNRAGRQCEGCAEFFYPDFTAEDVTFTCTACGCNLAGVRDNGQCSQDSTGGDTSTAGDCNCKQNVLGRTCDDCRSGFFNLSTENDLGCQACECSANGSLSSQCDPVTGVCPCKPNIAGDTCRDCLPGFYQPDPTSEQGCQSCNCNIGGSMSSMECDQTTGACSCLPGLQGNTCSELQVNHFFRGIDYLILEAEDGVDVSDSSITRSMLYTGNGLLPIQDGTSTLNFGSLTPPGSGLYEVVIRYTLQGALFWESATLTIIPSSEEGTGPMNCGDGSEILGEMDFEYADWTMGAGLSITRTFCLRGGRSYGFTLSNFTSGRDDGSAVLNIDSLVLIPVELPQLAVFRNAGISRAYLECVAMFRSLATRPSDPFVCRDTVFTVSVAVYNGAAACDCDIIGSVMGSVCNGFGGQCSCLPGVRGRRCDTCFLGFHNLSTSGCTSCACNLTGSLTQLCDPVDGSCMCTDNVGGQTCSSCIPDYWGFGSDEGCQRCGCDPTGSVTSQCDEQTGVCLCRNGVTGEACDRCQNLTFGFSSSGCSMCDCNLAGSIGESCDLATGQCSCLPLTSGRDCSLCDPGTFNLQRTNPDGCQPCFCSGQSNICSEAPGFHHVILSTFFNSSSETPLEGWRLVDVGSDETISQSVSAPSVGQDGVTVRANSGVYLEAPETFLGNKLSSYAQYIRVELVAADPVGDAAESTLEYDIILIGGGVTVAANFSRAEFGFRILLHESAGWVHTGTATSLNAQDLQIALSSLTRILITASFRSDVIMLSVGLDTALHQSELADAVDMAEVTFVENCDCPENYTGLSCEFCSTGYTRVSSGNCELCQCNGFSADCDPETGVCSNCSDSTTGPSCEMCEQGSYGDPLRGVECLPCPCPFSMGPGQFSNECVQDADEDVTCLNCPPGHTGRRCETCISGYFGDPTGATGDPTMCSDCQCSGNIDLSDPDSCNRVTGVCMRCLNNTAGTQCERCADGFFGDAVDARNCTACDCSLVGSVDVSSCSYITGQCLCLSNVTGRRCDQCRAGFYGFGQPSGCSACNCNSLGSTSAQCDESGSCQCLPGVTGQSCDQCLPGFFGLSASRCTACNCSVANSDSAMCDVNDGTCICQPGATGDTCQQCTQNFFQTDSGCTACPECYQDLEDLYTTNLLSLSEQEVQFENLETQVSDLVPFDERLLQYQMEITELQTQASDLVTMQNDLLVVYGDILFAANVTVRDRLTQINGSLDDLKRLFTTVYVLTFSSQELLNVTVSEFVMALELVRRLEAVNLPLILERSEAVMSSAANVADVADRVESMRANFTAQVEELRNATYMILSLSASVLASAEQLLLMQRQIWEAVENITSTYSSLDSELEEVEASIPRLELDLLIVTRRLQILYDTLPEIPGQEEVIYLTRNATETESYVRNDILTEITSQVSQFLVLNQSHAVYVAEFEQLFEQVSSLGEEASTLLQLIRTAFQQVSTAANEIQALFRESEMVAENLEGFNNETFIIGRKVAEAMANVESLNLNASSALVEAQNIEESLRNLSAEVRNAKEVAMRAFNISSTSFESVSSIDTGRIVASVNASLQSSLASMSLVTSLSEQVADIMTRLQALSADIRAKVEESDAADVINVQSAQVRDAAIAAVDRVRVALENLNPSDPSHLEEVREFIEDVSVQYENADLSGVYQTLEERLQEQRRTREGLEAELESLSGDIQRLRQVSSVLPTGCNGET